MAAKIFGVRVEEFGFGLPPRAKKLFVRKGTLFSLNWLPIGGFVKMKGEDAEIESQASDAFFNKPIWQRALILLAGVTMNFILGVALFGAIYTYLGIPTETGRVRIVEIAPGSPMESLKVPLETYVNRLSVDNKSIEIKTTDQLVSAVNENRGREVSLDITLKDGTNKQLLVTPRVNPPAGEGALGVALSTTELLKYPIWQMPFRGAVVGMKEAVSWGKEILSGLWGVISKLISGQGVGSDVSGPIGIYQVSSQVTKFGFLATLQFMGVLSINLAILNLIPFPALDGSRVVFLGVERLIGKARKNRIEGTVHSIGMMILMALMVLITIKDVLKLINK